MNCASARALICVGHQPEVSAVDTQHLPRTINDLKRLDDMSLIEAKMVIGSRIASEGRSSIDAINPFDQQSWATISAGSPADVDSAVQEARRAAPEWAIAPGVERAKLMNTLADALTADVERLALWESTDNGKVIRETRAQILFMARNLRYFAGYADKLYGKTIPLDDPSVFDYTVRQPRGVAALITAWNSPIALLANKIAPALATGNTVVIKPSEHASVTTCEFARIALEVGFPPGVINVVTGGSEVGDALTSHPDVNVISFTGGTETGRRVAENAARRLVPVTLELGGKSPNIIFDDASIDRAVVGAIAGIFASAGQTCVAGSRLLVQRGIYDQVVSAIAERARAIRLGDPREDATEMGPVANQPQFDRILSMVDAAIGESRLVCGGRPSEAPELRSGLFIEPTVFADVDPASKLAREEIFGPVLAVIPFDTEVQALQIANDSEFGLAAGIWTNNLNRAHRVAGALDVGVVWINTYRATAAQAPFGGTKQSGYGRERGEEALAEYTSVKNVMIDMSTAERDPFMTRT